MTDLRKAAEMALEALQDTCDHLPARSGVEREVDDAITALRQALAHEALDRMVAENQKLGLYDDAMDKQEPVDWEAVAADQAMTIAMMKIENKREWVGLTDEDIDFYALDIGVTGNKAPQWLVKYARDIERLSREKNL